MGGLDFNGRWLGGHTRRWGDGLAALNSPSNPLPKSCFTTAFPAAGDRIRNES